MVRNGHGRNPRGTSRGGRTAPIVLQSQNFEHQKRYEFQVERAKRWLLQHPNYEEGSTSLLLAELILAEFVAARKTGNKTKTDVAVDTAIRRLQTEQPARSRDGASVDLGEQIARDALRRFDAIIGA
jgi:hypothetical protein